MRMPVRQIAIAGGLAIAAAFVLADQFASPVGAVLVSGNPTASCNIKGNISISSGERNYHVPGQQYYAETRISPEHGERWFCSEAEARAAGWRRSRV